MPVIQGLYVITDQNDLPLSDFVARVARAIDGGARLVQYRDKGGEAGRRRRRAAGLVAMCSERDVPLIVNDDVKLAAETGAAGVHLGRDDMLLSRARASLGDDAIIGVSCYNRLELALQAEAGGADYVAFGSVYPSPTKPSAAVASLALLAEARRRLRLPIVAIGGIRVAQVVELRRAGADAVAVISGVFGRADIESAAAEYAGQFELDDGDNEQSR